MSNATFVRQGPFLLVQFNTTCDDALPTCDAMCCRMRPYFNVKIHEWEIHKYITTTQETPQGTQLTLGYKSNGDCAYLENSRCSIYANRPHQCRAWHCSPKGNANDPQIIDRANGWLLVVGSNEVFNELNKKEP